MLRSNEEFFPREGDNRTVSCERIGDWYTSIVTMRDALSLWQAAIDNNDDILSRLTFKEAQPPSPSRWTITFSSRFRRGFTTLWLYQDQFDPKMIRQLESGDRALAAKIFVQRTINEGMSNQISPRLLWNPDKLQHIIRILPTSLIGAMWWQFARAVAGEVTYRTCRICGRPILVSSRRDSASKPFRSDREFCSSACRQKDHRIKVKEAKRLRSTGASIGAIAKKLDTGTIAIQNWLSTRNLNRGH